MSDPTSTGSSTLAQPEHLEAARELTLAYQQIGKALEKVIVGQRQAVDLMMLALFCQGHAILEGVPGLAKTLMISSLAKLLGLQFGRIQFTPDLMPSDITGTEILEEDAGTGRHVMRFVKGPVFANIVLADEINRTPPKTQAALLQAMQEHHVTVAGVHHQLDEPFFVLGTQNPIESEGTYPLPEAQLDRFMFKVQVDYPSLEEEIDIAMTTTAAKPPDLTPIISKQQILRLQQIVRQVIVARPIAAYAVRLVRATRPREETNPRYVRNYLSWGAGPRACQALLLGAKARALLDGRVHASVEDIKFIARPVLRHRLVTNFTAQSESISSDDVVTQLLEDLPEIG